MKTTRVALAVVAGTLAASNAAFAQQAAAGTTAPTAAAMPPRAEMLPQGFSVVLVLGDLQGTAPSDDVPQAARKALTDMRDFLPYKSYKLLDAAWVMCCGQMGRRSVVPGSPGLRQSTQVTQTLRGPDEQEYELQLQATRNDTGRIFVNFDLKAIGITPLEKLTEKLTPDEQALRRATFHDRVKSVIDTTFLMDVGETVVVGTSRVKGGNRALIALLTAVATKSGAAPRE